MREIKFRGRIKGSTKSEWIIGDLWHTGKGIEIISNVGGATVAPETVGQFTGLLDSNGKEIYEGDILRFAPPWRWEEDERRVGVVVYKCYGFRIEYSDTSEALFNLAANDVPFTVIGNVHDNPNLLEADNARD